MLSKTLVAIALAFLSFSHFTFADGIQTYGDLYLAEEIENSGHNFKLRLAYGTELSNSFQSIHEIPLSFSYLVNPFFSIGAYAAMAWSEDRDLQTDLRGKLEQSGFRQQFSQPEATTLIMMGLRPLAGRLNFFQRSTLPFEIWTSFGYGRAFYKNDSSFDVTAWNLEVESFFNKKWGLHLTLGQEIESIFSNDSLYKVKARIGCSFQL